MDAVPQTNGTQRTDEGQRHAALPARIDELTGLRILLDELHVDENLILDRMEERMAAQSEENRRSSIFREVPIRQLLLGDGPPKLGSTLRRNRKIDVGIVPQETALAHGSQQGPPIEPVLDVVAVEPVGDLLEHPHEQRVLTPGQQNIDGTSDQPPQGNDEEEWADHAGDFDERDFDRAHVGSTLESTERYYSRSKGLGVKSQEFARLLARHRPRRRRHASYEVSCRSSP